ncbi:reverse transcriptase domain-containing protein [Tanacetum coccineum]
MPLHRLYWLHDPICSLDRGLSFARRAKMPSHVGSYDGKGDLDNYLHLFEDSARIWWNSQKVGSIINYEDLKAKFQSHFSQQKKITKKHLAVHNIKQKEGEGTRAFVTRYTDDTLQILGLHEEHRISGFIHGLRTRSLVEFLSTDLPTTYKGLMEKTYTWIEAREVATNETLNDHREGFDRFKKNSSWDNITKKVAKTFEPPLRVLRSRWSRDMTKYYRFHKDHGHNTNDCHELRHQIDEAVKSGQLSHLVKGIKKGKVKALDTQQEPVSRLGEITFTSFSSARNSSNLVIIKAQTFRKEVNRVYMDSGSSCEVIYENYFLKLKPSIRSLRTNSKIPLVGFSREHSQPIGEVPLEITISNSPCLRTETLNFVIVRSNSLHNLLLGRTAPLRSTETSNFTPQEELAPYSQHINLTRTIMVGGKPFNTEHNLNEYKHIKPVKQKKRWLGPDHREVACKEVEELMKAGIIQEVKNPTWVANPFMAYIDDMVIKSISEEDMLKDIQETLDRANPSKVKAVTDLEPPGTLKDVHSLNKKLAALSHFLSKGAEKSLPFFKALKSCTDKKTIQWTADADEAFQKPKKFMDFLPTLTTLIEGEVLVMYLAASAKSISAVLLARREEGCSEKDLKLYTDGASSFDGSGAGLMLISPEGKEYTYALRFKFKTTKNEAEYEALLAGLRIA